MKNGFLFIAILPCVFAIHTCTYKKPVEPDQSPSTSKVTCQAGCSTMSFRIANESGSSNSNQTCTRTYVTGGYIEHCTGTITYAASGKTYSFDCTYDWPNCSINVTVTGVGTCSATAKNSKKSVLCNCGNENDTTSAWIVHQKEP